MDSSWTLTLDENRLAGNEQLRAVWLVVRVVIDIVPHGDGCKLTLTQHGTPAKWASRTQDGWTKMLERQAASLGEAQAATNHKMAKFTAPGDRSLVGRYAAAALGSSRAVRRLMGSSETERAAKGNSRTRGPKDSRMRPQSLSFSSAKEAHLGSPLF